MRKLILALAVLCLVACLFCACDSDRGRVSSDPDGMITDTPQGSTPVSDTPATETPDTSDTPSPSNVITP